MRLGCLLLVSVLLLPGTASGQIAEDADTDTIALATPRATSQQEPRDFSAVVKRIIAHSQEFRDQQSVDPVQTNPQLTETAEYFAQYMADTNEYGHGADGRRPSERAQAHGYEYCLISENIAHLFSSESMSDEELARRFVEGWKESPEHRENMLDPAVTEIGVAVAQSEESGYIFAVQMFGRPESAVIRFEISNQTQDTLQYELGERRLELPPQYTRIHKRCRAVELTFLATEQTEQERQTIEPRSGDRLKVVQTADGRREIQRQQAD